MPIKPSQGTIYQTFRQLFLRHWKASDEPWKPPPVYVPPPRQYRAVPDVLFPGTWRAEPVNYKGRGMVYLFHGEGAQREAEEYARHRNTHPDPAVSPDG